MPEMQPEIHLPESPERLSTFPTADNVGAITESLRSDQVVLIERRTPEEAETIVNCIAGEFGLQDSLRMQATLAGLQGHRHSIGDYFMSVNERADYQFIPPHSEGTRLMNMQLAAFYCYENSTDGGETLLLNVNDSSSYWKTSRELVKRVRLQSRALSDREILRIKGRYKLDVVTDVVKTTDKVIRETDSDVPGVKLLDVLAATEGTKSVILGRDVFTYWDSVSNVDFDSAKEFTALLQSKGLLRQPTDTFSTDQLDSAAPRRMWHSGVQYERLFKALLVRKLVAGDLLIQNNLTWAHAAANWTPGKGLRKIAASFA